MTATRPQKRRNYLDEGDIPDYGPLSDEDDPGQLGVDPATGRPSLLGENGAQLPGQSPADITSKADPYGTSIDDYKAALARKPVMNKPNLLERLAAGAFGGAAGWTNAAGRTRPIDIKAGQDNILHPGYQDKLSRWQGQVGAAQAQSDLEGKRLAAQEAQERIAAQAEERKAHAQQRLAQASPNYGKEKIDPEWAKVYAPEIKPDLNGDVWIDKSILREKVAEQQKMMAVPEGSSLYRGGHLLSPGTPKPEKPEATTTVTDPVIAEAIGVPVGTAVRDSLYKTGVEVARRKDRNMEPGDILLHPQDFDAKTVKKAQEMFDKVHRAPSNVFQLPAVPAQPSSPNESANTERNEQALARYPVGVQSLARMLANYDVSLPQGRALSDPKSPWVLALQAAKEYDRQFNVGQYKLRQDTKNEFTRGAAAKNIRSLNTLLGHLDRFADSAEGLNNSNYPMWNAVANAALSATGDPRIAKFEADKAAVTGELATTFKGTATEGEINRFAQNVKNANSMAQLRAVTGEFVALAHSRLAALKEQYETTMGRPASFHFLTPESQKVLSKYGVKADDLAGGGASDQGVKIISRDMVQQYATEHTIPYASAVKVFTDKHYQIQ